MARVQGTPRRRSTPAGIIAIAILAIVVGAYLWNRSRAVGPASTDVTADPATRVAVSVLENRTGDPTLDRLGQTTADALVEGLTSTGVAEIMRAGAGRPAATLVTGSYSQTGPVLEFQVQLVNASDGSLIHAIDVVRVTRSTPEAGLEAIRQRVMGAVATEFDDFIDLRGASHVPGYDAVREYQAGIDVFDQDKTQALRQFQRAFELDPAFVAPRLRVAMAYRDAGLAGEAAKVIAPLVTAREGLSALERALVDSCSADLAGRPRDALDRLRDAEQAAPQSGIINYLMGRQLVALNEPRWALDAFARRPMPTRRRLLTAMAPRFVIAADARHMLADYAGERDEVRNGLRLLPQSLALRGADAGALAGLGKPADAVRAVDDLLAQPGPPGPYLLDATREFRAHGHAAAAQELASHTVAWYTNRPPDETTRESTRVGVGQALYNAERWDGAVNVFRALVRDFPDNARYLGYLGAVQARRGDRGEALRVIAALQRSGRPDTLGENSYQCARIAGLLGDHSGAVDLLRQAFARGFSFSVDLHREMDFEALRGFAPFQEVVKPGG